MKEFLKLTKTMKYEDVERVHVVMGNEACDMDSAVCALTYAYYLYVTRERGTASSGPIISPPLPSRTLIVPVLNIPRQDYSLRTDIQYIFTRNGITADLLTFRDELNLLSVHTSGKLSMTLVDFNVFPGSDRSLEAAVVNVIDHRPKERKDNDKVAVQIEMVGSCSTLIAEIYFSSKPILPPAVVDLLYNAILTDTVCLSPSAGKTTPKDETVISQLEKLRPTTAMTRQNEFNKINSIRQDVSGLHTSDLLRKDLKVLHSEPGTGSSSVSVAMSSIMEHVTKFLKRPHVVDEIDKFSRGLKVTATILMFAHFEDNTLQRQLAVFSQNKNILEQICQALIDSSSPNLDLCLNKSSSTDILKVYGQNNAVVSRKGVLPIIVSTIETLASQTTS